jgi:hypothetical protein
MSPKKSSFLAPLSAGVYYSFTGWKNHIHRETRLRKQIRKPLPRSCIVAYGREFWQRL